MIKLRLIWTNVILLCSGNGKKVIGKSVKIYSKLTFKTHLNEMYKKAGKFVGKRKYYLKRGYC